MDIGHCGDARCVRNDTNFTGNECTDKRYCCRHQKLDKVPVLCARGVRFNLDKVEKCGCAACTVKMAVIQGIVVGGADQRPVKYGRVIVEGLDNTGTDGDGRFSFQVPEGMSRVVVTFEDYFQTFESTTKAFTTDAHTHTFYKIRLPEKRAAIEFNSSRPEVLKLGEKNQPSFAEVEIAEDSFVSEDGSSYAGQVNARVGFTDPRNVSDILMAPGDFSALDEDGEEQLLISYGMLNLKFEDSDGKRLDAVKPITLVLDPEEIDVTDKSGNQTAKLWWLDKKTGRWVQAGELRSGYRSDSRRRRKRSNRQFLIAELTEAVPLDTEINIDDPSRYNYVAVWAKKGAVVTMVGKKRGRNQFAGYRQKTVGDTGKVCIPTYTDGEAYLLADKDGKPLTPIENSSFPQNVNATIVGFPKYNNGQTAFRYNATISGSEGPIYPIFQPNGCTNPKTGHYAFQFNDSNQADQSFFFYSKREETPCNSKYWFRNFPRTKDLCYVKVFVNGTSPSVIMVESSTTYTGQHVNYGYSAALTKPPKDGSPNQENVSVTCLEYRCNGIFWYENEEILDQQTLVTVIPLTASCTFKSISRYLQVRDHTTYEKAFLVPDISGKGAGLYSGEGGDAKARCEEGNNNLRPGIVSRLTAKNPALTFECHKL